MSNVDWLGADGGRLAGAFAAGCIATFAFMTAIGSFIWRMVGGERDRRIKQLETDLDAEKTRCNEMEIRLGERIHQLETILLFETVGQVRQNAALAIAELHQQIKAKINAREKPDAE